MTNRVVPSCCLVLGMAASSAAPAQAPLPAKAQIVLRPETSRNLAGGYLSVSPDGRWLTAGEIGSVVRVWDLSGQLPPRILKSTSGLVQAAAFSHDSRRLFAAGITPSIQVWNPESEQLDDEITLPAGSRVYLLAASPDGRWLAAHSWADRSVISLWDLAQKSGATIAVGPAKETDDGLGDLTFSPDGKWLAAAHRKGRVRFWEPVSRKEVHSLRLASGNSVAFSRDGRVLAAGDRIVSLWDTTTWKQAASWNASSEGSNLPWNRTFAFSPDGQRLAGASNTRVVRLWRVPSGARIAEHETRHASELSAIAFAPSGRWFATLDANGIVVLWDGRTAQHLASLVLRRDGQAWAIASADGHFDGSPEGVERIIGWRVGEEKFQASHFAEQQLPGLLQRIASGEHVLRGEERLAAVSRTQAEAMALFKAEAADRAAARVAANRAHPFGGLAESLVGAPLHGSSLFSADALQKIFVASGCEGAHVLKTRIATTDVWLCVDKKAEQRAVLNVIRPAGPHPLIYVNSSRKLYAPDTGFAITRSGPLALMMGGTVVDTDLGTYQVTRVGGTLTQALGATGQLVALRGQANQFLVIEYSSEGERIKRGLSQSRQGKIVRFNIGDRGLAYYVEDLQRLETGDTLSVLGEKGNWWSAQIASPLDAAGVLRIVPARIRIGGSDAVVQELALQKPGPGLPEVEPTAMLVAR